MYHNCTAPGPLACGVPYTCCIPPKVSILGLGQFHLCSSGEAFRDRKDCRLDFKESCSEWTKLHKVRLSVREKLVTSEIPRGTGLYSHSYVISSPTSISSPQL